MSALTKWIAQDSFHDATDRRNINILLDIPLNAENKIKYNQIIINSSVS